jgi:hypothetical protein
MTITMDELSGTNPGPETAAPQPPASGDKTVRITEWVDEIPQHRRVSPFDAVVEEIRQQRDPSRAAKIEWGEKPISPNKVNQLRKRYTDLDFRQVTVPGGRETYVSYKGDSTTA